MTEEEKEKKISLSEYAEKSGNEWILEEPETYYRYKYEFMTFQEWAELFD